MSSDSMSWMETGSSSVRASAAAAIQPAVPPPTMTMLPRRASLFTRPIVSPIVRANSSVSRFLEPDPERPAHRARVTGDIADRIQAATGDQTVCACDIDVIHQVLLVAHVEDVEPQVERCHVR